MDLLRCPDVTIAALSTVQSPSDREPIGTPHESVAESITFAELRTDLVSEPRSHAVNGASLMHNNPVCAG